MLTSGACDTMYPALNDTDTDVRHNVYETLIIFSASLSGECVLSFDSEGINHVWKVSRLSAGQIMSQY